MPIYEYQCDQCGETTEVLQKFSDNPLSECPACGGPMHKLMSMNSFQLKGSGWYVTDYAGKTGKSTSPDKDDAKKAPAKEAAPCASAGDSAPCKACPSAAKSE